MDPLSAPSRQVQIPTQASTSTHVLISRLPIRLLLDTATNAPSLTRYEHRTHQERNGGGNGNSRHGMDGPEGNTFCPRISCALLRPANEVIDTGKQEDALIQFKDPYGTVVPSTQPKAVSFYNDYSIASNANYVKDTTTQTPPTRS